MSSYVCCVSFVPPTIHRALSTMTFVPDVQSRPKKLSLTSLSNGHGLMSLQLHKVMGDVVDQPYPLNHRSDHELHINHITFSNSSGLKHAA